jgi:hypothetical protein
MKPIRSPLNPWPAAIVSFFAVAILGLTTFIVFASRQKMDLVRPDYYQEELGYQRQLDRMNRTHPFGSQVAVDYDAARQAILITLPPAHARPQTSGHIQFYRPSDARLDHDVRLAVNGRGLQQVDAKDLQPGLWKVRVFWKVENREYFFDQSVVVPSHPS